MAAHLPVPLHVRNGDAPPPEHLPGSDDEAPHNPERGEHSIMPASERMTRSAAYYEGEAHTALDFASNASDGDARQTYHLSRAAVFAQLATAAAIEHGPRRAINVEVLR